MSDEKNNQEIDKDLVIKLDSSCRVLAESILAEANEGIQFKKKVNFKEMFEHLLRVYGKKAVPDLMNLRVQAADKLKLLYLDSGTTLDYQDWLVQQLTTRNEVGKRSSKKKELEGSGVS